MSGAHSCPLSPRWAVLHACMQGQVYALHGTSSGLISGGMDGTIRVWSYNQAAGLFISQVGRRCCCWRLRPPKFCCLLPCYRLSGSMLLLPVRVHAATACRGPCCYCLSGSMLLLPVRVHAATACQGPCYYRLSGSMLLLPVRVHAATACQGPCCYRLSGSTATACQGPCCYCAEGIRLLALAHHHC